VEEYIEGLYQYISKEDDLNKIKNCLPSRAKDRFDEIMDGVIFLLEKEKQDLKQLDDIDSDFLCEQLENKICLCKKIQDQESDDLEQVSQNLIFASSHRGNNLIETDILSIEKEKYPIILKILKRMMSGYKTNNHSQQRKFTNNNDLKDCFEYKGWQIRVIYQIIDEDSIYINLIKVKKSTNDRKDIEEIVKRIKYTNEELKKLKKEFKNPSKKEKIISEHKTILDDIFIKLETKKSKTSCQQHKIEKSKKQKCELRENFIGLDPCWISMYNLAKVIYENEGTIKMKVIHEIHGVKIGKWIHGQKQQKDKGLLQKKQIQLLEDLDIEWFSNEETPKPKTHYDKWMENYNLAKEFFIENGHLNVPTKNKKLSSWLYSQKNKYKNGKLSEEQIMLLEEIGINWSVRKINRVNHKNITIKKEKVKTNTIKLDDIDRLSYDQLYEIKGKVDRRINEIESQRFISLVTLYENMYKHFNEKPDLLSEFILMLESDNEALAKSIKKRK